MRQLDGEVAEIEAIGKELSAFIDHVSNKTNASGIQVFANIKGHQILRSTGRYATEGPECLLPLACSIKMLLAYLTLSFADEKVLNLQDPIKTYLPETGGTACGDSINTGQLLSHTSGYAGTQTFNNFKTWDDVHKHLSTTRMNFIPGSVYSYEHTEALVTAEILRRVSGKSIKDLLFERLLTPALHNGSNQVLNDTLNTALTSLNASVNSSRQTASNELIQDLYQAKIPGRLDDLKRNYVHEFQSSTYSMLTVNLLEAAQIYDYILRNEANRNNTYVSTMTKPVVRIPTMFGGLFKNHSPTHFGMGVAIWNDGFAGISSGFKDEHYAYRYNKNKDVSILVRISGASYFLRDLILDRVCERFADPVDSHPPGSLNAVAIKDMPGEYYGPEQTLVRITLSEDNTTAICEFKLHNTLSFLAEISLDAADGYHLNSQVPNLYLGIHHCEINHCIVLVVGGLAFRKQ